MTKSNIRQYFWLALISPFALAGLFLWAFLLWNNATANGRGVIEAFVTVFSRPKS